MNYADFRRIRLAQLRMTPRMLDDDDSPNHPVNRIDGLIDLLEKAQPRTVLEIGCCRGISTETILLHAKEVWAVDFWQAPYENAEQEFMNRCGPYPHLHLVHGKSPECLGEVKRPTFDMVYLDGDHEYQSVKADIAATVSRIKKGGVLAGHDHNWQTVRDAVAEFCEDNKLSPAILFSDASWMVRV